MLARRSGSISAPTAPVPCGAFASETDLGTGLQRPLPLGAGSSDDAVLILYRDCPPRTLIRVYWPLEPASTIR